MTRYFGYTRVSSAKQGEGVSLAAQKEAINEYASRHDLTISAWFEEKETAAKRGRRVFTDVLKRLRKGEAKGLIVHKIDRSARNLRDWAELNELMDEGIEVHFAHESLDLASRGGRLSADIQAVVAADYIRNLSEETKKGHLARLKQGLYPFATPFGYLAAPGKGLPKRIDPVRGPLIRKAFELYATGNWSLRALSSELYRLGLRSRGGKQVVKSKIAEILHNPFYKGTILIKSTGEIFPGKHEPLITDALFRTVQRALAGKSVRGSTRHNYLFRGLFNCGLCNRVLTPERQKGHVYYRCHRRSCPTKTIREEAITSKTVQVLKSCQLSPKELSFFRQEFERKAESTRLSSASEIAALKREQGRLEERLTRLTTAFVDGDVDRETYLATKEQISEKLSTAKRRLAQEQRNPEQVVKEIEEWFELSQSPLLSDPKENSEQFRRLLQELCSNRTLSRNELTVELSFPFERVANYACVPDMCPAQDDVRTEEVKSIVDSLVEFAKTAETDETLGSSLGA